MDIQSPPVAAKKRAPRSPLKCVIVTLAVFGLLVCIGVSYALYSGLRALLKNVNDPHRSLFPEKTPEHRDSGYVWPLIAENDKFDIVLGIWAREPDGDIDPEDVEEAHGDELAAEALTGMPMSEIRGPWKQRNLYEEVVFQSVGLQGKMLDREVHFKLPLDRLDKFVFFHDVRATVTLLPAAESFNGIQSYSDWRPAGAEPFPRLTEQYMSSHDQYGPEIYEGLEHLASSVHLIDMREEPACEVMSASAKKLGGGPTNTRIARLSHPHLLTRAHVYMIKETRPFESIMYNHRHAQLRSNSCGQGRLKNASRWLCERSYNSNGNWELRYDFTDEEDQRISKYGPYIGALPRAAGPKDVISLPVMRPICNESSYPTAWKQDLREINVTFHLRFSTLSHARVTFLENANLDTSSGKTDRAMVKAHDTWQQTSGLFGDHGTGTRPFIRLALSLLADGVLLLPSVILGMIYWYTRTTTAGVSILGTLLLATSFLVDNLGWLYYTSIAPGSGTGTLVMNIIIIFWDTLPAAFMLQLVSPYGLDERWRGVKRRLWTHRERASRRLGEAKPLAPWILGCLALWGLSFALDHYEYHLVPSRLPSRTEADDDAEVGVWLHNLSWAIGTTACLLQLRLNRLSRTFAGNYALVTYLNLVRQVCLALFFTPLVGIYEAREHFGFIHTVDFLVVAGWAWQAITYPRVEQAVEEDD